MDMRNATATKIDGMTSTATIEALLTAVGSGDESMVPVLEDAILAGVYDAGKTVYVLPESKGWKRGAFVKAPERMKCSFAVVVPGKSIRVVGIWDTVHGPRGEDRTFAIGELAEYDSFNLSYYGAIESITAKRVVIREKGDKNSRSLTIGSFYSRNKDFDAAKAFAQNSNEMSYL